MQIGLVVLLFAASLLTLGMTVASVVKSQERRSTAEPILTKASNAMARRGAAILAAVPPFPLMGKEQWTELDARLAREVETALTRYDGVEGGYYVSDYRRFVGAAFPTRRADPDHPRKRRPDPPPLEYDLIETQADAAIRKGRASFVVAAVPPSTVAFRTAPVIVNGRAVGATWTMTRLVSPADLGRPNSGYGIAAGLALGGIALALILTIGMSRSLRREANERNRLQAELRRSDRLIALGKLLAGVAHEVRNPLAGIRGITQLWRRGLGQGDEALDHLIEEVDRLETIVSRLLQFSREDAQDLQAGDLGDVVSDAARLAEARAAAQGVRVELEIEPGLPPVEMAAPALLQLLRNLTTNALQVMPDKGTLRLEAWRDGGSDSVAVRVTDTGPGLAPETQRHLFEPFFTTKAEGTGLGLAIAREIALAHRGSLVAENRPGGRGAVFTLFLPVVDPALTKGSY
jgi:signal transduction histidine kinase